MNIYIQLFSTFMKVGAFTFGGGWAMIPIIEKEVVQNHHWMSDEEFVDALSVAQSMPGVLAVNISILVGNKLRGLRGSTIATLGTVLPSFSMILLIAIYLRQIYNDPLVEQVFMGIRPAVVALIVSPVLSTAKSAKINLTNIWIPIAVALLIWLADFSPIYFIVLGALGGIGYFKYKEYKRNK